MSSVEQMKKKEAARAEAMHHMQYSKVDEGKKYYDDGQRSIGQDFFPDTESNREFFARERANQRRLDEARKTDINQSIG